MTPLRPATATDVPALEAFLTARAAASMFPMANLRAHGLGNGRGGEHPHAMRFRLVDGQTGIAGALGLTAGHMLMPQWPGGDWSDAGAVLPGAWIDGAVGPAEQVRPLLAALGLDGTPSQADSDQPAFALDRDHLTIPEGPGPEGPGDLHNFATSDLP